MDWTEIAKTLAVSHKTRVRCECGDGTTKIINHNPEGYSYFCFRCGDKDFVGKGKQTLEELAHITKLNAEAANVVYKIELPDDFTPNIPAIGRLWLFKGGVTESQWKHYNFGWSEKMQRVVMPVYNQSGKLIWFQARAVHNGQKPKYLNPSGDRSNLIFYSGYNQSDRIILVEDILSAIRVGSTYKTCSLLGTKITTRQANQLRRFNTITTWLDNDRAGIEGAYNVRRLLGMVTEVQNICTARDPKCYSDDEIREILCTTNETH